MRDINMKTISEHVKRHPYVSQLLISVLLAEVWAVIHFVEMDCFMFGAEAAIGVLNEFGIMVFLLYAVMFWPRCYLVVITMYEVIYLVATVRNSISDNGCLKRVSKCRLYDFWVIFVCFGMEYEFLKLNDIRMNAQWFEPLQGEQLYDKPLHTPLNTDYIITFIVISLMFVVGMLIFALTSSKKRTALGTVICFSAMYMGLIEAILFLLQIMGMHYIDVNGNYEEVLKMNMVCIYLTPVNMILIMLRLMFLEMREYRLDVDRVSEFDNTTLLGCCNEMLSNSKVWPVAAFMLMILMLEVIILILTLFGQTPDAVIKVFTETANYTFSTKIPPL